MDLVAGVRKEGSRYVILLQFVFQLLTLHSSGGRGDFKVPFPSSPRLYQLIIPSGKMSATHNTERTI